MSSSLPTQLQFNNKFSRTDMESANLFADFFASVYSDHQLDPANLNAEIPKLSTNICVPIVDETTVWSYLKSVKFSFFGGPDKIPSCVAKICADMLSKPLSWLFNLSLSSGTFPDVWKDSYVLPLHKSGPKSMVSNYRGIAKLCVFPKIFEHIIADQLSSSLQPVISQHQHGFMRNKSTVTNLLEFTSLVTDGFSDGKQTDVTYTDIAKAFDRLCQTLLCWKLDHIGLPPILVKWVESYLTNRYQCVLFNNAISRKYKVTSGVPQGSHLGPLLFNLFINDLPAVIKHCSILMFADDVKLCYSYNDPRKQNLVQDDLNNLLSWCRVNGLTLNIDKCKVMCFSWRSLVTPNYVLDGAQLEVVSEYRDLGVLMDPKLSFVKHINAIICKARSMLGFIKRWSIEFKDPYITKLLFTALVRPLLEYASPVWSPSYAVHSDAIESVQKQFLLFALRGLPWDPSSNLPPYEHRLKLIRLPTLRSRRIVANVCFLLNLINGNIFSPSLLSRINFNIPNRLQRSLRFFRPIYLRTYTVNYLDSEPFRSICKVFNTYYFLVCFSNSISEIKSKLFEYLNR